MGVTYPLHGEQGEAAGLSDDQAEQVDDEEEDLEHLARVLAKGLHQSSCYYRLSMFLHHLPYEHWMDRPEGGIARGSDFQRKFKGKRGAGSGCIEVNSLSCTGEPAGANRLDLPCKISGCIGIQGT